ncbi:gliding motility protein GldC [Marinoscillum sp. MHG1-6]|uniref:gliding motility protein GldC n=1 Tax=Marinoscillum sp. MHG1-6 TaxID=2959627 RepID=UPI002157FBEB|nr:gliding motility protein GldC [Marinoscillum sp. MHG1-6]
MKDSEIKFKVQLDDQNIPEKIYWDADQKDTPGYSETKSISVSLWDHEKHNTLRIDLWTKEMPVDEMKKFYIDCLGGLAQSVLNSTGDEYMSSEMNDLCERLVDHLKRELN